MRGMITPERLAERVCRALDVPAKDNAEGITEMLRTALTETRDRAIERRRPSASRSPKTKRNAPAASGQQRRSRQR